MTDVVAVRVIEGRTLELRFEDGLTANVDIDRVVDRAVFFNQVRVDPEVGTIVWPNGADICPDVLYSYASGKPIIVDGVRVLK